MSKTRCIVCNCEKSMPIDGSKLEKALDAEIDGIHMSLCRAQLGTFEAALASSDQLIVACTQEAPLFSEVAEELSASDRVRFANIRENAGWSADAKKAHPKIAALLADASHQPAPTRLKAINSDGMCLVYGSGQAAFEAAQLLSQRLSVSLLLSDDEEIILPSVMEIPVYRGTISHAGGSFGGFEISVDGYAPLRPASRENLQFAVARNEAKSKCSLILDMSGKAPLFTGHGKRDGYKRVDPADPAGVLKAVFELSDMVGEFEKPIYVNYNSETCAHSRSGKTGCNKCLDACPAGAIFNAGEIVEIDSGICGGCGLCHASCPTGSVSYQYPTTRDIMSRVQNMLATYERAGGSKGVLLLHDASYGTEQISAIARFGKGLPANHMPMALHASTLVGHVELLGMIAAGASAIVVLADPRSSEEHLVLETEIALANKVLEELGLAGEARIVIASEADPNLVEEILWEHPVQSPLKPATFDPVGSKREVARLVFGHLHAAAGNKPDQIDLPTGAPYGAVEIDQQACTLCMACASACPANAITDTPGEPKLRFTEAACVQCGLCVNTCPEKALTLHPRLDFTATAMQPVTLYEEEPFECISCGTPFATRSTIERIAGQLAGKHSMFGSEERSNLIKMCENCRIEAQANSTDDPFVVGSRPKPRTTEDYLTAESGDLTAEDFLNDD